MQVDFFRKYMISAAIEDVDVILELLDPSTYERLFGEDIKIDALEEDMITNYMSEKDANMFRDYRRCKDRLKNMEKCCKNLASLAMLYKAIIENYVDMKNGACQLYLNTMQAYELHITLVTHMRRKSIELGYREKELDSGNHEFIISEYQELTKLHNEVNTLKLLNLSLIETVTREVLYAVEDAYDDISPENHIRYCII